jgi:hypothetical protein
MVPLITFLYHSVPLGTQSHIYMTCTHYIGVPVVDASQPEGSQGRQFDCRGVLLHWDGDYPAQCKVGGHHEKVCHWCEYRSEPAPEINRRTWGGFRRWLPANHPYRGSAEFGPPERNEAPPFRTHESWSVAAEAEARHTGAKKDAPHKTTGDITSTLVYPRLTLGTYS